MIIFGFKYFTHIHLGSGKGIISDSDCLVFDKEKLICFLKDFENINNYGNYSKKEVKYILNVVNIKKIQNIIMSVINNYGNLNEDEIEYLFKVIRFIILNNSFYEIYKNIKEYQLLDCTPEMRFYSSIQLKNELNKEMTINKRN